MHKSPILIVAGERSGDLFGAGLARALAARLDGIEFFGCGGEALRDAGADTVVNAHDISLAGITEVVRGLPRVYRAYRRLLLVILD
jgi:lipid-A-disaccharide synthase